jgi:tRNA pseudouridine55 synthase
MTISAFYYIDKPIWFTSFDVLRVLRKKLNMRKMWHTGTLDPLATGGLLVAVWNYTKLIPYFEKDQKEYDFVINLDGVTDSYDSETPVTYIWQEQQEKFQKEYSLEKLEEILQENFSGNIEQIPPKYSALKINGKKALDKVRAGDDFEMKIRKATIFTIAVLSYNYPELKVRARVSAGTYIRSIAFDLGELLWTGGYITYLRRTLIGDLDVKNAQLLDNFDEAKIYSTKELFKNMKIAELDEKTLTKINDWLPVNDKNFPYEDGEYFVTYWELITNIISYEKPIIKAKRKI